MPAKKGIPEDEASLVIVERKKFSERSRGRKHDSPIGGRNPKVIE